MRSVRVIVLPLSLERDDLYVSIVHDGRDGCQVVSYIIRDGALTDGDGGAMAYAIVTQGMETVELGHRCPSE